MYTNWLLKHDNDVSVLARVAYTDIMKLNVMCLLWHLCGHASASASCSVTVASSHALQLASWQRWRVVELVSCDPGRPRQSHCVRVQRLYPLLLPYYDCYGCCCQRHATSSNDILQTHVHNLKKRLKNMLYMLKLAEPRDVVVINTASRDVRNVRRTAVFQNYKRTCCLLLIL